MLARGRLGGQHHGVSAVVDRRGDVRRLGARGHGTVDHRLEHLRGHDHRLSHATAATHDALLYRRHLLGRQFHAEIPARHHHRVGQRHDLVEPFHCRWLLELGDDESAVADQRARLGHVVGALNERQRDPVGAQFQRQSQISPILRRERRQRQHHAWHVDPLAFRQIAAHRHARVVEVGATALDHLPQPAIVEQQFCAGNQRSEDFGMRHAGAAHVAGRRVEVETEGLAFSQHHRSVGEGAYAQLRALKVGQDADRAAEFLLEFAQQRKAGAVIDGAAVAEVQSEYVHAATKSWRTVSLSELAGPRVATILAFRVLRMLSFPVSPRPR